jgi:4-nitrophenyl phosphatase
MEVFDFSKIKSIFLDMDGVLWNGKNPIGNTRNIFTKLEQADIFPVFITNNSTRTPESYQEKMAGFGVKIKPDQVITPAVAASYLFKKKLFERRSNLCLRFTGIKGLPQKGRFYLIRMKKLILS